MKYTYLLLKELFLKKVLKMYFIYLLLILVYLCISFSNDMSILIFGLNDITFFDQIRDMIRIINVAFIFYICLNYYFYDMYRNPEFHLLRINNKKYFIKKLIILFVHNIILFILSYLILSLFFRSNINVYNMVFGTFNIVFNIISVVSFLNLYSNSKYFMIIVVGILFIYNLFYDFNLLLFLIIIIILIYINIIYYSSQKNYNKYIR